MFLASSTALTGLSLAGKAFTSVAFEGIYIFSAESFPTEVRHVGMGSASFCARVGGMIAPYMGPPMVCKIVYTFIYLLNMYTILIISITTQYPTFIELNPLLLSG